MRIRSLFADRGAGGPGDGCRAGGERPGQAPGALGGVGRRRKEFAVVLEVKGNDVSATITPKRRPQGQGQRRVAARRGGQPASLDWVKFSTPDGIEVPRLLSIYRLEGDRLIVRSGGFNDARPKAFEAGGEGIWTDVMVFTRPGPEAESVTSNP